MNGAEHYPPPDFSGPPPNSSNIFQAPHQSPQPYRTSFQPSMWSWSETPVEPSWQHGGQPGWGYGYGPPAGAAGAPTPYGKNFGRGRHRGRGPNYGSLTKQGKQRNKKEPEYSHFCDTCDRGFKNQEKYDEHVSQHVKCSVSDCNFMAHEKIVSFHWKNTHAPGAKRIKLDTLEDISRWRQERRKNYPSLQNILKKQQLEDVRAERGGVLETAQFGRMRGRGRGRCGRGWGNRGAQGHKPQGHNPPSLTQPAREADPLGALVNSDPDSDREDPVVDPMGLVVPPKQMSSGLGSLMANYGSMSESEDDEGPEAMPIQRAKELVQENQALLRATPTKSQDNQPSLGSKPRSQNTETLKLHPAPDLAYSEKGRGRGRGRGGRGGRGRRQEATPQQRRPTLLEMLLAPDVRHERNVLLQCVRYVVRNNFFGLENKSANQVEIEATAAVSTAEPYHRDSTETVDECMAPNCNMTEIIAKELSGDRPVDLAHSEMASSENGAGNHVHPAEQTTAGTCQSLHLSPTDKTTSTSYVYDDDIWESPAAVAL